MPVPAGELAGRMGCSFPPPVPPSSTQPAGERAGALRHWARDTPHCSAYCPPPTPPTRSASESLLPCSRAAPPRSTNLNHTAHPLREGAVRGGQRAPLPRPQQRAVHVAREDVSLSLCRKHRPTTCRPWSGAEAVRGRGSAAESGHVAPGPGAGAPGARGSTHRPRSPATASLSRPTSNSREARPSAAAFPRGPRPALRKEPFRRCAPEAEVWLPICQRRGAARWS